MNHLRTATRDKSAARSLVKLRSPIGKYRIIATDTLTLENLRLLVDSIRRTCRSSFSGVLEFSAFNKLFFGPYIGGQVTYEKIVSAHWQSCFHMKDCNGHPYLFLINWC